MKLRTSRALHLFSGPNRDGDFHEQIVKYGMEKGYNVVIVVDIDTKVNSKYGRGDVRDENLRRRIIHDAGAWGI